MQKPTSEILFATCPCSTETCLTSKQNHGETIKKESHKYKSIGMLNKHMSTFSVTAIAQHTHDSPFSTITVILTLTETKSHLSNEGGIHSSKFLRTLPLNFEVERGESLNLNIP